MQEITFLQDIAVVMLVGAAVTIVFRQLRLPVVLGYLLAGLMIGPHTPPYALVTDIQSIRTLSELGIIFLLFGIGTEFSLSKIVKVGLVPFFAAAFEIVVMLLIGFSLGRAFGWEFMDSIFLGAILSVAGTTIIAKLLMDNKKTQERFAQIILGILVMEDIVAIVIIAVLSGLVFTGEASFVSAFSDLMKVFAFVMGVIVVGLLFVPRLLAYVYSFQSSEMMVVTVLGLCFGTALLAAKFGFSVALGAFLIGAVVAETKEAKFVIRHFESLRDMFTAVFFVSVGMMFEPKIFVDHAIPIFVITLVFILGKVGSCFLATFMAGDSPKTALKVGLGLAQIGEFSYIIARMGEASSATSSILFPIAVAVSGITALTTPFLMKYSDTIADKSTFCVPPALRTFAGVYSQWIKGLSTGEGVSAQRATLMKNIRIHLPKILLYAMLMLMMINLPVGLAQFWGLDLKIVWMVTGLFMVPLLLACLSSIDQLFWQTLASHLIKSGETEVEKRTKEQLHNVMRFVFVIIFGVVLLAIHSFFIPSLTVNIILASVIALAILFLWETIQKLHNDVEKTIWSFFDREVLEKSHHQKTHDELVKLIQEDYPWGVETQDFMMPYHQCAANRPLKDLEIRFKTGVSVVAIYRDDETIVNPGGFVDLRPGDVLLLMGSRSQIQRGVEFLNQKVRSLE